jgi:hypothetical protein
MFGRKQTEDNPETALARCIVLLDDIRAYRRKDVEQIDAQFDALKKSRFKDHYDTWVKVRPAAEKIIDMPMKVPGAKKLIKVIGWMKVVNKVFLIFLVLFAAFQIVPIWRRTLGPDFLSGAGLTVVIAFVVLVVISLNVVTFLDYRIRKKIIKFEDETMDEYSPAREKMKEAVSKMMKSLAREVARSKKSPDYYGLVLYFDDYENIEVVDKWRPKSMGVFKKSYNHFQVVPKP